jgi:hypothetical protein
MSSSTEIAAGKAYNEALARLKHATDELHAASAHVDDLDVMVDTLRKQWQLVCTHDMKPRSTKGKWAAVAVCQKCGLAQY